MQKSGILSQPVIERLKRHSWSFGTAGLVAALGMAGAIAVAPDDGSQVRIQTVIENLPLNEIRPLETGGSNFFREERVLRGDTVGSVLSRLGIQDSEASEFIRSNPATQAMHRQLAPGKIIVAQSSSEGELHHLVFPLNGKDAALVIERKNGKLIASEQALRFERHTVMRSAEIHSSLFAATDGADIPDPIATQLAEIFASDIDFHSDLRKGDRFSVVYEMAYLRGQPARAGRILAAEFVNHGRTLRAIYFEQDGKGGYYTADGRSMRKAFLRSPLEFSRITSGFSMRLHPILQQWRAHKGVDYGAPSGTRVRATGDGVVEFMGVQGGYGNVVVLRHHGAYSTAYGHLRGFAADLKKGSRVSQGDTIGFVGQTGWATGPHLHYEFRINNQQVNPLSANLPVTIPLEASQMARFKAAAQRHLDQLSLLRDDRIALKD